MGVGRGALAVTVRGNDDADAGCNVGAVISCLEWLEWGNVF